MAKLLALFWLVFSWSALAWPQEVTEHQGTMLFEGLRHPWDISFLDENTMLITERPGRLRVAINNELVETPVSGLPDIYARGQAGLFEVLPHPDFSLNKQLFFTGARLDPETGKSTLSVFRATWRPQEAHYSLSNVQEIFTADAFRFGTHHYGGRMLFLEDGSLLVTSGDGGERTQAQNTSNHLGTVFRIDQEGRIPNNNPFYGDDPKDDAIYSYGHRNPQGIAFGPGGAIYSNEHGPRGGDEINQLIPGANYGWPLATFGKEYSGAEITKYTNYPGTVAPLLHWTPSIAPSSLMYYEGKTYPTLSGYFLTSALSGKHIRASLPKFDPQSERKLLSDLGLRWRAIALSPDGILYAAGETQQGWGSIWQIQPL